MDTQALRIRARAAEARLRPMPRSNPAADEDGQMLAEIDVGRGRVFRISGAPARGCKGHAQYLTIRLWADGEPTGMHLGFRSEAMPAFAIGIADALDGVEAIVGGPAASHAGEDRASNSTPRLGTKGATGGGI